MRHDEDLPTAASRGGGASLSKKGAKDEAKWHWIVVATSTRLVIEERPHFKTHAPKDILTSGGCSWKRDVMRIKTMYNGVASLYGACEHGHLKTVKLMLDHGCDANKAMDGGQTPMYIACVHGHHDIVQLLLEKRCDASKAKDDGQTPLCITCDQGRHRNTRYIRGLRRKGPRAHTVVRAIGLGFVLRDQVIVDFVAQSNHLLGVDY